MLHEIRANPGKNFMLRDHPHGDALKLWRHPRSSFSGSGDKTSVHGASAICF